MTVEPIATQVLIQILEPEDENKVGGVFLPQIDYKQRQFGKILATGFSVDPEIKAGDVVCFTAGMGTFIDHEINGKTIKCLLMEFAHIKYILEDYDGKSHGIL